MQDYFKKQVINWANVFFVSALLLLCALSTYIEFTAQMNADSANALHNAEILFAGGKYFTDFYETTPPMFLYLNFPVVEILKYFPSSNLFIVFFSYYFLLTLSMIYLCALLIEKKLFVLCITFIFLVIGVLYFGQREHTALIFTLPYFLLMTLRLEGKKVDDTLCILIGILAGIGFSVKPQFCLAFFFSEIYFFCCVKSFTKFMRIENSIVYSLFIIYLISTFIIYPDYFYKIIPLTEQFYYTGIAGPFFKTLIAAKLLYIYITFLFYLVYRKDYADSTLMKVLLIGMTGYVFSYFSEVVPWDYHLLPAFGFCILLNFMLIFGLATQPNPKKFHSIFYILLAFLLYRFDVFCFAYHPYFLFAWLIFCVSWYLGKYCFESLLRTLSAISIGVLILVPAIIPTTLSYDFTVDAKNTMKPIKQFLQSYAYHKTVYFLTGSLNFEYPTVDYAGAISDSRFPYLLWMTAYLKEYKINPLGTETARLEKLSQYFLTLVGEDIALKKPEFIFLDTSAEKTIVSAHFIPFDYLPFFLKNSAFRSAFKAYHFFGAIHAEPQYTFLIYQRNNPYEVNSPDILFCKSDCAAYLTRMPSPFEKNYRDAGDFINRFKTG